jgi:hypothetical protein
MVSARPEMTDHQAFESGVLAGERDAREAWEAGTTWVRPSIEMPRVSRRGRQRWLGGYAAGFAALTRQIEP